MKNHFESMKKGFTLAEVLITLGIIGVVAAITLPTLVANYQKKQTVIRLKEAYTLLNQAIKNAELKEGDIETWDFGSKHFDYSEAQNFVERYLIPQLKVANKCYNLYCLKSTKYTLSNKTYPGYLETEGHTGRSIFLTNGMQLWAYSDSDQDIKKIGIGIDLNGGGRPNIVGRDIFFFLIQNNSSQVQMPGVGWTRDGLFNITGNACNTTAGNVAGMYCGALIQQDGWEIKSDYPWK